MIDVRRGRCHYKVKDGLDTKIAMDLSPAQAEILLQVAKTTIVRRLQGLPPPELTGHDPALMQPAGCFVSLHARANHALRGCVGRMDAAQPLTFAVRDIAASVLGDPRFTDRPVTLDEVPQLDIEISVLSPMRQVPHPLEFDPAKEGIHLTLDGRSGVFLPVVARETGWSREQLLARLCTEKLGFPPNAWQSPGAVLHVFTTLEIGPVPF
jgi:AmmeMemoRadiSam system protein A